MHKETTNSDLEKIKSQKWFYEFTLPDGSKTESYLPEDVKKIHTTRENALRNYLENLDDTYSTALDISCHEGYFSLILAEYFQSVTGIDKNTESLEKARQIINLLNVPKIKLVNSAMEDWQEALPIDFVLCYGLLYHVENPVEVVRKLAELTKKYFVLKHR